MVITGKIAAFCKDQTLRELRQAELKDQCLHFWQVPNEVRKAPRFTPAHERLNDLLKGASPSFMLNKGTIMKERRPPVEFQLFLKDVSNYSFL